MKRKQKKRQCEASRRFGDYLLMITTFLSCFLSKANLFHVFIDILPLWCCLQLMTASWNFIGWENRADGKKKHVPPLFQTFLRTYFSFPIDFYIPLVYISLLAFFWVCGHWQSIQIARKSLINCSWHTICLVLSHSANKQYCVHKSSRTVELER